MPTPKKDTAPRPSYMLPRYYARRYRALGWSVIPCLDRSKMPSIPWAEYQRRLPTYEEIDSWEWENIGIITGRVSGIVVIDEDDLSQLSPQELVHTKTFLDQLPPTATVLTGKGKHRYFLLPGARRPFDPREDPEVDNSQPSERLPIIPRKIRFLPGLDCCGEGGLVIAPPSIHPSGKLYVWDDNRDPEHILAYLPEWVVEKVQAGGQYQPRIWQSALDGVTEGQRNVSAAAYIGYLIKGKDPKVFPYFWPAILEWNKRNKPPLDTNELRTIFLSICKREADQQKRLGPYRPVDQFPVEEQVEPPSPTRLDEIAPNDITLLNTHIHSFPQAIDGLLPSGLVILAGKPKVGKSRLALQLAIAVANNVYPFDLVLLRRHHVQGDIDNGKVLYMALEDSNRRIQERTKKIMEILRIERSKGTLHFLFEFPRLVEGGLARLQRIVEDNPDLRMIVIDTMTAFTIGPQEQRENAFFREYRMIQPLQEMTKDRRLTIMLVAHAGKDKMHAQDWQDALSGTLGVSAAADAILLLAEERKHKNAPKQTILHGKGRDIEGFSIPLLPHAIGWAINTTVPRHLD